MASTVAHLTPEVLRWARESTGYTVHEAATGIGVRWFQLDAAEEGQDHLTLRQAEKAADLYGRPLAALFLPEPPEEAPQEAQFRRLPGAPAPPWPPAMHLLARRIAERQAAAKDLLEMIEEPAPWLAVVERLSAMDGARLPDQVRELLGISLAEQGSWSSGHAALRAWIDATEALGILVMQDGSMDLDVMRGFAAQDDVVPAVVINTKDDPRARVFTIVHELGHLVRAARGVPDGPEFEPWCNDFSGEVLMPSAAVTTEWRRHAEEPVAERVAAIARTFQVTRLAAAVRVARAHLLSEAEASSVIGAIRAKPPPPAPRRGGGDYYWNQIGALGPRFTRLILDAVGAQAITYPAASMLLGGVKANHMATLREYLDKRYEGH